MNFILEDFELSDPAEDLAYDFVENEVGRRDFSVNWSRILDKDGKIRHWLARIKEDESLAPQIKIFLDKLASEKKTWT